MKTATGCLALLVAVAAGPRVAVAGLDDWAAYLDYAYVYCSADPEALKTRLGEYSAATRFSLEEYIVDREAAASVQSGPADEADTRRLAVAHLLQYLARGEPESLEASVDAIRALEARLTRHENRYWYHYILAHRALEKGRRFDFVGEMLDLWLRVVVPLETPYETLQTLSLDESPNSGFASALPYIYENTARMILLRSQKMGVDRDLDPLAALVRLLHDDRVGAHPEVIPVAASSRDYLDRIVGRLDGPESDGGSLTFTVALFEASKYHDRARGLLAGEGLGEDTLKAIRVAVGAYQTALERANTEQGRAAVYTRVLRQLGEVYAAKQRLGVDPEIDSPFSIEGAIEVYGTLQRGLNGGWKDLGYAKNGRQSYLDAMHGLWQEIQEATLNVADYYLARSVDAPHLADDYARNAARLYSRYLAFFYKHATAEGKEGVPESAYFAAHEAAKGTGDAYLVYAARPTSGEIDRAIRHYRSAMKLFPFDRTLWSSLTAALERQGRESDYMALVRPAADAVVRSRSVNTWIDNKEVGAKRIATLRRTFSDSLALMYLGFADASGVSQLERSLAELRRQRPEVARRLESLQPRRRDEGASPPAAPATMNAAERAELNRQIAETSALLERLDKQIGARTRTLPLYKATLETDGLAAELRQKRDHPVHTLLRRMYYENRG